MAKLKVQNRYGVAPHTLLYDASLSLKAKGLYTYMQAKPDGWEFSAERIAYENKESRDGVRAGLRELEQAGYLRRVKYQDEGGYWQWEHILLECPVASPETDYPSTVNPTTVKPSTVNPSTNKERSTKKETENNKQTSEQSSHDPIVWVIDLFSAVDAKNKRYYANTTQRAAAKFLVDEYGFDQVKRVIEFLPQTNGRPYVPTITTPHQLMEKWTQLESALLRLKNEREAKSNLVI